LSTLSACWSFAGLEVHTPTRLINVFDENADADHQRFCVVMTGDAGGNNLAYKATALGERGLTANSFPHTLAAHQLLKRPEIHN